MDSSTLLLTGDKYPASATEFEDSASLKKRVTHPKKKGYIQFTFSICFH
jgi:hypothetical protein